MYQFKTFYGGTFLDESDLSESKIDYKVELEYYKTNQYVKEDSETYGFEIVKKEYINNQVNIESKEIDNITSNSEEANKIINTLKKYKVTPIGLEDVLDDLLNTKKLKE